LRLYQARVLQALHGALDDPRARWLLGPHPEARTEWPLTVHTARGVQQWVIDRFFRTTDGVWWIVDYKTGTHLDADRDAFLDREQERYRGQLEAYARALARPVHCGLYFPLLGGWRSWSWQP
jgi:ATP-dependent exoDNAse (exonuclease V) beta subunit